MKKTIATMAICGLTALGVAAPAHAGGPTCSDTDTFGDRWGNHGEHVTGDYVMPPGADGTAPAAPADDEAARGAPAHPDAAPAPGASFCLMQASSPGVHFP